MLQSITSQLLDMLQLFFYILNTVYICTRRHYSMTLQQQQQQHIIPMNLFPMLDQLTAIQNSQLC